MMTIAGADASTPLEQYLDERQITDSFRGELLGLPDGAKEIVVEIIDALKPSANTLRDVMRLSVEICRRDRIEWTELFADEAAKSALSAERRLGPKDRAKELKRFLERKRFPETAGIEADIEQCRKQLAREAGLSIEYPRDLEGDSLSVTLKFTSPEELAALAESAAQVSRHPSLARMFGLLKGEA